MRKKSFLLVLALLLCTSLLFGCTKNTEPVKQDSDKEAQQSSEKVEKSKELVVGMSLDFPPFETTDANGKPTGVGVDMAYDLGKSLGRDIRIENIARSGLIPALQTKKIDMIISSMTITAERQKTIDFSKPYAKGWMALLINKNSPVQDVNDLNVKGRKIAVHKGTIAYNYAQEHLQNAEVLLFDDVNTCMLEVIQGKADAMIYDQITVYDTWKQNPDTTRVNLSPIDDKLNWGVGIRKEDKELTAQVNAFIDDYKQQGGFDKLADKYLSEKKKTFAELGIPFFFD
ncbi:MAG: transporter substrate-binding domain-containing protein [Syntrophomonadaceae bacterium]|nr:transporter substrate-binding domain-containing protein [Syntrophomonadaceae bacterium]